MTTDEQKRKIQQHLLRSSDNLDLSIKRSTQKAVSVAPPVPVTPIVEQPISSAEQRKKAILDHLSRSTGNSGTLSLEEKGRQQRIKEHLRLSQS